MQVLRADVDLCLKGTLDKILFKTPELYLCRHNVNRRVVPSFSLHRAEFLREVRCFDTGSRQLYLVLFAVHVVFIAFGREVGLWARAATRMFHLI